MIDFLNYMRLVFKFADVLKRAENILGIRKDCKIDSSEMLIRFRMSVKYNNIKFLEKFSSIRSLINISESTLS